MAAEHKYRWSLQEILAEIDSLDERIISARIAKNEVLLMSLWNERQSVDKLRHQLLIQSYSPKNIRDFNTH